MTPHTVRRRLTALLITGLLALAAHAQTDTGSGTTGSGTGSGTDTGSGTGSGVVGSGTTSYDAPNTYDLGGGTVTLATAILNGGTVTNGAINASTGFTGYSGTVTAQLLGSGGLTKTTSDTLVLAGTNNFSGGTTVSEGTLQIGDGTASATFTGAITNNATVVFNRGGDYAYGNYITGTGDVVQNGDILRLQIPQTYTGRTLVNSGYLVLAANADQGLSTSTQVYVASGAYFDISNHATTGAGLTGAGTVYSFGGSSGHLGVAPPDGERQVFSGTLGGSYPNFAFTKSGTGTLVLSGANTYTGNTDVSAGTLLVNGSLGSTATTVASGATLGGTGSISGATTIATGGILAPGDSVGTLTFHDGLSLASGAVLSFDLGTTGDLIVVDGGTLAGPASGSVTVNLANAGGLTAATYTLFNFTGATLSDFDAADFSLGTSPSGWSYTFGLTADSLQVTVSAVPEPSTIALALGAAGLGCVLLRRRRALQR
ncbi:MAG: autotransporter-associated beta strand repeat-containing protein [Candidatus Didemnitutus sp.]|nr:autotransporter-associated beta strand repeat-containing protein [Candidatus Didemnitutus sp.]